MGRYFDEKDLEILLTVMQQQNENLTPLEAKKSLRRIGVLDDFKKLNASFEVED